MKNFDPDLLRTLVAFAEAGTLARAAAVVGRTPSAVTAQMQRLEDLAEVPLLKAEGRRRVLTEAGECLVGHARRILAANRDAWLSVSGTLAEGRIGLGLTQDFLGEALTGLLNAFARSHPRLRLDLRIGRTVDLAEDFESGRIALLIAARRSVAPDEIAVLHEPMLWLSAGGGLAVRTEDAVPLAALDPPCGFREAAIAALDAAGRPYRIAATSSSLAGICAAVAAGIAVTARTARCLGGGLVPAPKDLALPPLPSVEFSIRLRQDADDAARRLGAVLTNGLGAAT